MPRRYWLIVGTFLMSMLLYVDRACMSAAKPAVAGDLGFSETEMGWVFAAFSLGYALFQTPAGAAADRFGPRVVLSVVVCLWSVFTGLTTAARTLWAMLAVRFLFGAGEAGAFPGMARALFAWMPVGERGLAHGINFSASRLGAAAALPLVGWLVSAVGWRLTFVLLGAVGFVWATAWWRWFRDDPADHPGLSDTEREYILRTRQTASPAAVRLPVRRLLGSMDVWLMMSQYVASNFVFFFCLTWLTPYLARSYGLDPVTAGWYAAAPLLAGMVGNWTGGWLVDAVYRRGRHRLSRAGPAILGFALAAGGLSAAVAFTGLVPTVAALAVAVFGADMTLSPSWSFCSDIGGRAAGLVSATMNTAGNLGAFLTSLAFPYLLAWTGSPDPFFWTAAGLSAIGAAAWSFARPARTITGGAT